jgi:hypothetical protein
MTTTIAVIYCCICRSPVPEERVRRKAVTCSDSCQHTYRNQKRQHHGQVKCRLCGRRFRKKPIGGAVLHQHTPSQSLMDGEL